MTAAPEPTASEHREAVSQGQPPREAFVRACALADVPDPGAFRVEVGDTPIAVVRSDGEVYAIYDVCSHAEVSLSEGEIYDTTIECWLHGSCFDLRTGAPTGLPATGPVPVYQTRIDGDDVYVRLEES
jgi:3-phenylpropionate/trans-cinnamate dioxygenase ferredoxin component